MPSLKVDTKHGYSVEFSPFLPRHLACASSENYGLKGTGSLLILENDNSDHLKLRKCSNWPSGLLDVSWLKSNDNLLVTSSCDGSIQLWKLFGSDALSPLKIFKEHTLDVPSVDSNNDLILSGSWDSAIKVWDINNVSSVITLTGIKGIVHSVKWSPAFPNLLASVSDNYHLCLWDKSSPLASVHRVTRQKSESLDCDWSHHNPYELAVCGNDGAIRLWDIRTIKSPCFIMSSLDKPLGRIKWSPHYPNIIGSTSYNLSTGIWDINRGGLLETIRHHSGFILGLDFNKHVPGEMADCGLDSLVHVFTPWSLLEFKCKIFLRNKL